MSVNARHMIDRQVHRVRRRLMLQKVLESLVGFWAGGLGLSAGWFVVRPFVGAADSEWAQWGIPAGVMVGATLAGILWAMLHGPKAVAASLALDQEFNLNERVTTFAMLSAEQLESPAGQALLEDVKDKVMNLKVAERFPVRLRWRAGLAPVCAGLVAVAASFFAPSFGPGTGQAKGDENKTVDAKEIQQQLDNLRKVSRKEENEELKSEKLKELEEEWAKLVQKPLDPNNKEQVRERAQELKELQDKMQKRAEDLRDKKAAGDDLKKQLEQLAQDKLGKKLQEGPAKDLEDALAKGKFDKAQEVLDKLRKDLEKNKLNPEEMKKLAEQMKDLQEKLKRLMDQKDLKDMKDRLQKDFDENRITKEELDRELDRFKDLEELADLLGECKDCLGGGNGLKAGERIKAALEKLKAVELSEQEMKKLLEEQKLLEAARLAILRACEGDCDANGKINALGKGKRPGGVRPEGADPNTDPIDTRQKAETDPLGQQRITGFSRGGTFKKIPSKEVGGAFQRADQEAGEAIDRQRIPTEAVPQVRGYFEKLGKQR